MEFPFEVKSPDKEVMVMQVIRTTNLRRGDGNATPIRAITQYWSMDGELLAEVDPLAGEPSESYLEWEMRASKARDEERLIRDGKQP